MCRKCGCSALWGAIEIREDCWRKVQFAVTVRRSLAAFETAISVDWGQSKSRVLLGNTRLVKEWVETAF